MVKGEDDGIYLRFHGQLRVLAPELVKEVDDKAEDSSTTVRPLVVTEGKTDWKHLKNALRKLKAQGQFGNLEIEFREYDDEIEMGDTELLKMCTAHSKAMRQPSSLSERAAGWPTPMMVNLCAWPENSKLLITKLLCIKR